MKNKPKKINKPMILEIDLSNAVLTDFIPPKVPMNCTVIDEILDWNPDEMFFAE